MKTSDEDTFIRIKKERRARLKALKIAKKESYDEVIKRLLKYIPDRRKSPNGHKKNL